MTEQAKSQDYAILEKKKAVFDVLQLAVKNCLANKSKKNN